MAIKKAYEELVAFLEENKDSKVKTILPAVEEMCSKSAAGGGGAQNYIKDADGNVTHVFCYYHKMWEPVTGDDAVEYGVKQTSATGLNSMCKEGTSQWTKQQRAAKKAGAELLDAVANGEVAPEDIKKEQEAIDAAKAEIVPREDGVGSADKPEA